MLSMANPAPDHQNNVASASLDAAIGTEGSAATIPKAKRAVPIAVGLIHHAGKLVVGRRPPDVAWGGFDEFPGGKIESGEDPAEAVARECREETGLKVRVVALRRTALHDSGVGSIKIHFFDCEPADDDDGGFELTAPFRWVEISDLGKLRFPDANRELVAELLGSHEGREP